MSTIEESILYFDVEFISPTGSVGIHYAVPAETEFEAMEISPHYICAGTNYDPDDYTILSAKLCTCRVLE